MKNLADWQKELEVCTSLTDLAILKQSFDAWETQVKDIDAQIKALEEKRDNVTSKGNGINMDEITKLFYYKLRKLFEAEFYK